MAENCEFDTFVYDLVYKIRSTISMKIVNLNGVDRKKGEEDRLKRNSSVLKAPKWAIGKGEKSTIIRNIRRK